MMKSIDEFIESVSDFNHLSKTLQIDYFTYYLIKVNEQAGIACGDISDCFNKLNLPPYTNIPQYLKVSSQRSKRNAKYFLKEGKYYLTPYGFQEVNKHLGRVVSPKPSNALFPHDLFQNTRSYLKEIVRQALVAYDYGLYDACSVMLRRVLETLIIEMYEKLGILDKIKDKNGEIYFLKQLVDISLKETSFSLSRNTRQSLAKLKSLGDLSAHNRRYIANKSDLDNVKDDIRITFQDLLTIIDYPTWKN